MSGEKKRKKFLRQFAMLSSATLLAGLNGGCGSSSGNASFEPLPIDTQQNGSGKILAAKMKINTSTGLTPMNLMFVPDAEPAPASDPAPAASDSQPGPTNVPQDPEPFIGGLYGPPRGDRNSGSYDGDRGSMPVMYGPPSVA